MDSVNKVIAAILEADQTPLLGGSKISAGRSRRMRRRSFRGGEVKEIEAGSRRKFSRANREIGRRTHSAVMVRYQEILRSSPRMPKNLALREAMKSTKKSRR